MEEYGCPEAWRGMGCANCLQSMEGLDLIWLSPKAESRAIQTRSSSATMLLLIAPPFKSYQASSGVPSWLQPSEMSNDTGHPTVSSYRTTLINLSWARQFRAVP